MSQTGQIRVALAQINPTVGDLKNNSDLISKHAFDAANAGAVVVVYPEMILTGYPVEDLANRPSFRAASINAINELATRINNEGNGDLTLIVGYLGQSEAGKPQNCAAVIYRGEVVATYIKHHLPNYGVFDEYRNFTPGNHSLVIRVCGVDIGIAICEDIWQSGGPVAELAKRNIGLMLVPNGSPFEINKYDARLALVQQRAIEIGAPLAYVNMTGGADDLVFDGDTIVVGSGGEVIARAPQFEEGLMVIDLDVRISSSDPDLIISNPPILKYDKIKTGVARRLGENDEIWQGLVLGLRDYVEKNNFKSVLLGVSGGIDSALVAALASDAIGADRVFGVALPSKYSSVHITYCTYVSYLNHTTVPTSIVHFFWHGFFPAGYFPLSAGNNFFFPPYDSFRRLFTEARGRGGAEATKIFPPPPPPPSDPTTSPAPTYRPELTPFVQSLTHDLIDHPPPTALLPFVATAATRRQ